MIGIIRAIFQTVIHDTGSEVLQLTAIQPIHITVCRTVARALYVVIPFKLLALWYFSPIIVAIQTVTMKS